MDIRFRAGVFFLRDLFAPVSEVGRVVDFAPDFVKKTKKKIETHSEDEVISRYLMEDSSLSSYFY